MIQVTDLQYLGSINYYKTLFEGTYIVFDISQPYRKMSFRNRCIIAGANGLIELSVPLVHGRNQRIPYEEVMIDNMQKWQIKHWRSITSAYNKTPWFEYYKPGLEVFFSRRYDRLFEFNTALWEWTLKMLKSDISWELITKNDLTVPGIPGTGTENEKEKTAFPGRKGNSPAEMPSGKFQAENRVNLSDRWLPSNYLLEPPGWPTPVYHQVFEDKIGFHPNLSIIDLLCALGPDAKNML